VLFRKPKAESGKPEPSDSVLFRKPEAERRKPSPCPHCGAAVAPGARHAPFCCAGCREVRALLAEGGLDRFYELGGGRGVPASDAARARSFAWLEPLQAAAEGAAGLARLDLDVQGVHCAACVWLMDELFRRRPGGAAFTVNPALGRVSLAWERGRFDPTDFLSEIERFGYRFGPARKKAAAASDDIALRLGVCAALTMNVGLFAAAFYLGLAPHDGSLYRFFGVVSLLLSTVVVLVGGWPFFRAAVQGTRRRVLHLDLPIATGIASAYAMSVWRWAEAGGAGAYFDTICTFATLMLAGRWLQQRVLDRNRAFLLDDGGLDGIQVRRREGGGLAVVDAARIRAGDGLLLAPGEPLPVDAVAEAQGTVSTDWSDGESEPRAVRAGETLRAGSFNAGREALPARATGTLADSPLPSLLHASGPSEAPLGHAHVLESVARWYVPAVALVALAGFLAWLPHGTSRAADVAVALLVVTCPCALGIAVPLALEVALSHLRGSDVFVRSGDLLRRILRVRTAAFDKTGTLTLGRLVLREPDAIRSLPREALDALHDLASRSNHPASRCLAEAARGAGAGFEADARVVESPGDGLELMRGIAWRLGRPEWALGRGDGDGTVLSRDGREVARFRFHEEIRADAHDMIGRLGAAGITVWILSGDRPERVNEAAAALGVDPAHVQAGLTPRQKAEFVRGFRSEVLFVGDGVNDAPAFAAASATGTPAVDRPVMPGRADFFLLGESIAGVWSLFHTATRLRTAVRAVLVFALTYNVISVTACLVGWMTPLRAALAMPASSLTSLAVVLFLMARARLRR